MNYRLPGNLREALLKYLEGRPYNEVAEGIMQLSTLEEIKPVNPEKKEGE